MGDDGYVHYLDCSEGSWVYMSKVINIVNFENVQFIVCQLSFKAVQNGLLNTVIFI